MSERNLWRRLSKQMTGVWKAPCRHEDNATVGVADVSFCCGKNHHWLELKFEADWPARATTIVKPKRFTQEQKNWLEMKGKCGGNVWVLWQVGDDHMLYTWRQVHDIGTWNKADTVANAHAHWARRLNYEELDQFFIWGC